MPTFNNQPLHYDIVGSFLRPQNLKDAREKYANNEINKDQLTEVENQAITDLVNKEKEVGLKIVTDGEFRRSYWHLDSFWGFNGIKHTKQKHGYQFHGKETRNDSAQVSGKISFNPDHPDLKAFKFLYNLTKDDDSIIPRQSIPSPAQLYVELFRGQENIDAVHNYYDNLDDLVKDIGKAYHDLIIALYDAGCRDVKLDDCTWGMVVDKNYWKTQGSNVKYNLDEIQQKYLEFNNEAIKDLPSDLHISTHDCRGNYASHWASAGGYGPIANTLFGKENVQSYYLEYDDARSGGFEPLSKVSNNKDVVLGLVTSKRPELEKENDLIERIKEASKYVPLDRLSLSTQCGFSSTEEGNDLTEQQQWDKIKLVINTANQVWSA